MRVKGVSKKTPSRTKFVKKKAEELSRYGLLPAFMKILPRILAQLDEKYPGMCVIGNSTQLRNQVAELKAMKQERRYGYENKPAFNELVYFKGSLYILRDFDYVEPVLVTRNEFTDLVKNFLMVEGCTCYLKLGKEEKDYSKEKYYFIDVDII